MFETAFVIVTVAAAAAYLIWCWVRAARGDGGGCASGCGCNRTTPDQPDRLGTRRELINVNVDVDRQHSEG